jgi:hypothetical protein
MQKLSARGADNEHMRHAELRRTIELECWLASLAYAARFKRVGRTYFSSAVMVLSFDTQGDLGELCSRFPSSV